MTTGKVKAGSRCHPRQRVGVGDASAVENALALVLKRRNERSRADVHLAACPRPKIIILAVGDVAVGLARLLAHILQAEEAVALVVQQFPLVCRPSVQGLPECPLHLVPILRQCLRLVMRMKANRPSRIVGGSPSLSSPAHSPREWPQVVLRIVPFSCGGGGIEPPLTAKSYLLIAPFISLYLPCCRGGARTRACPVCCDSVATTFPLCQLSYTASMYNHYLFIYTFKHPSQRHRRF